MSILTEVKSEININKIPIRIALYEQLIESIEPFFTLDNKNLEKVVKEHIHNLMTFDIFLQECIVIENVIKSKMEEIEAELYRKYTENYQRALNTREVPQYVKGDPKYVEIVEIFHEVNLTKRKLESVTETLKSMNWSLTNITKLRIAQLEMVIL